MTTLTPILNQPMTLLDPGLRDQFPALLKANPHNGKPILYFDSACMSVRPKSVLDAWMEYHENTPSCAGRASHAWAVVVDEKVKRVREEVRALIGASRTNQISFVRNTSEALNIVARGLRFESSDVVITTGWEHNSNLIPWFAAVGRDRVLPVPSDPSKNTFDLDAFAGLLATHGATVRVVALALTSNFTGYTVPLREIIEIIESVGQKHDLSRLRIVLDAAQAVPYVRVNLQAAPLNRVDFLAFSFHKMCGPTAGVLYMRESEREDVLDDWNRGGGTVEDLNEGWPEPKSAPDRFEAGLQDYAGIIAAGAAIGFLTAEGRLDRIGQHVTTLNRFVTERLSRFDGDSILIVPPVAHKDRGSIVTLRTRAGRLGKVVNERLTCACADENIYYRQGNFCVQSAMRRDGTLPKWGQGHRFSLYLYNTLSDCESLVDVLSGVLETTHG